MHALILADLGNDWSLAGSIETFAIPVGLFLVVAAILYFLFTRPHAVPGHRDLVAAGAGAASAPPASGAPPASAAPSAEGDNGTAPNAEDGT